MILRPHSLDSFRPFNQYTYEPQHFDMRKKIQNFTFHPSDKIGRGYSSIVYKGINQITKQPVAIKVIELKSLRDQNTKRFLQNELECLRRLDHPNVLRYINSFMTSNNCYIITELYNGGDLGKMLKDKIFLRESQILDIFKQFYQGYLHFHLKGFIHRDIKPTNILIQNKNTDQNTFVIADFGFVKNLDQKPKDSFNVGTPVYMAPESITSNLYTVKSDIWSIGVMLFQMAYGFLPFQCKSQTDLKKQICNKELKLQDIQNAKQISMSIEFKTLVLSCLRKNPQNRISLEEISQHPWLKKSTLSPYDLTLKIQNSLKPLQLKQNPSFFMENIDTSDDPNNYGFIGNQAIKREKSLHANNFALKNHQKNNVSFSRDYEVSIDRHKQKAKQLGILSLKNSQKQNQLKIKEPQPYFAQQHLVEKLKAKNKIQESPKINYLIEKKNGVETRPSMLEGMKGIVNIKNSHILKINYENKAKNMQKTRQSYQKVQNFKTLLQVSTSVQEAKTDSAQSLKSNRIQNIKAAEVNSFQNLHPCEVSNLLSIKTQTSINNKNMEQIVSYASNQHTTQEPFYPMLTEPCTKKISSSPKKRMLPRQFYLKSIHMLRFIFQNLSILSEFNGDRDIFNEIKKQLEQFLVSHLVKLKKSLQNKDNLFRLSKWEDFCQNDGYVTFFDVIEKYYQKYSQSSLMGKIFKNYSNERVQESDIERYKILSYSLLKSAEELSTANKQIPKKSIRNSSSFNASISLIYNLQKSVQMAIKFKEAERDLDVLLEINPEKDLELMTGKSKDPFKIPKMVIQLKKKLITLESGTFSQKSQLLEKQNLPSTQNIYKTGRASLR